MPRVLFVDDDLAGSEAVLLYLQRSGFDVEMASSGRQALRALTADQTPDLILLDVQMPEMDGLELLKVIRSYLRWQQIPVILLTAYADSPAVMRAATRFHADLISKANLDLASLAETIRERTTQACAHSPDAQRFV